MVGSEQKYTDSWVLTIQTTFQIFLHYLYSVLVLGRGLRPSCRLNTQCFTTELPQAHSSFLTILTVAFGGPPRSPSNSMLYSKDLQSSVKLLYIFTVWSITVKECSLKSAMGRVDRAESNREQVWASGCLLPVEPIGSTQFQQRRTTIWMKSCQQGF
jgi:hypothetical protein